MSSEDEGRFASIDVGTTDYGALLTQLGVIEVQNRLWRSKFRMPRIIFPVIPVTEFGQAWSFESATARNLRVSLYVGATQTGQDALAPTTVSFGGTKTGMYANAIGIATDGTNWVTKKSGSTKAVPASGASPLTIFAAAGAGLKRRIFDITLSSSAAGVVVLSDGLGSIRATTGPATTVHYGPDGILQDTANTAITATLAAATLEAIAVGNAGE